MIIYTNNEIDFPDIAYQLEYYDENKKIDWI